MKGGRSANNAFRSVTYRPRTHFTEITLIIRLPAIPRLQHYSLPSGQRPSISHRRQRMLSVSTDFSASIVLGDVHSTIAGGATPPFKFYLQNFPDLCYASTLPSSSRIAPKIFKDRYALAEATKGRFKISKFRLTAFR